MLIILIDRWQVLSYLIRMPLLNREANHAIWQKSWSTIKYSAHCLSLDFWSECLQRRKKSLSVFVLDSKTKEDDKIVLQSMGFEINREHQGLLLQSRKMAKRWQSFWKTHRNYREIEFHEFLGFLGASFLGRELAKLVTNSRQVHPSSETQGQAVEPGEKARRKFSSTGGRAPGYRLSQDYFQTVKRMLAPDWINEQFLLSYFREVVHDGYYLATVAWFLHQAFLTRQRNDRWVEKRFGCYQQEQFN